MLIFLAMRGSLIPRRWGYVLNDVVYRLLVVAVVRVIFKLTHSLLIIIAFFVIHFSIRHDAQKLT